MASERQRSGGVDDRHRAYGSRPPSREDPSGWVIAGEEDAWAPPPAEEGQHGWPEPSWHRPDATARWRDDPGWQDDPSWQDNPNWRDNPDWQRAPGGQSGPWQDSPWADDSPGWNDPPPVRSVEPPAHGPEYDPSGYAQPGYPQPGYPDPGRPDPGYSDPGYPGSGYPDSRYSGSGYPDPGQPDPGYADPWDPGFTPPRYAGGHDRPGSGYLGRDQPESGYRSEPGYRPEPAYQPEPEYHPEPEYITERHPGPGPTRREARYRPRGQSDTGWITTDGLPVPEPEPAESQAPDQDSTASRATVAAWTIIYFTLPTLLYLSWAFTRSATPPPYCVGAPECPAPRTEAFAAFLDLLPALAGAVVLAVAMSMLMRRLTRVWRPSTVGLAAAVIGAGLATLVVSIVR